MAARESIRRFRSALAQGSMIRGGKMLIQFEPFCSRCHPSTRSSAVSLSLSFSLPLLSAIFSDHVNAAFGTKISFPLNELTQSLCVLQPPTRSPLFTMKRTRIEEAAGRLMDVKRDRGATSSFFFRSKQVQSC